MNSSLKPKGLFVDIIDYSGPFDIYVDAIYLGQYQYLIMVKRLDSVNGWTENLSVFAYWPDLQESSRIIVGSSVGSVKYYLVNTEFPMTSENRTDPIPESYTMLSSLPLQKISRAEFNQRFSADIVVLPTNLYAVGVVDDKAFIYNEAYQHFFQIELTLNHLISVIRTRKLVTPLYFILCGDDGYMESHYPSVRDVPQLMGEHECLGKQRVLLSGENEFAVFHRQKVILGQNVPTGVAYTYAMPDRYYFCLNLFNQYRSYHRGLAFQTKKPLIVYASNPRGSHYNFTKRRDILMPQREYFYSSAVPKDNIYVPGQIPCKDMVEYKYLLDIDGWAGTWEATAWKLNSGSVIFKVDSGWSQWFSDQYFPWIHYVPVADDFSDLQEKFQWCEAHQDECLAMIRRCQALFQRVYRFSAVVDYVESVLRGLSVDQASFRRLNTAS